MGGESAECAVDVVAPPLVADDEELGGWFDAADRTDLPMAGGEHSSLVALAGTQDRGVDTARSAARRQCWRGDSGEERAERAPAAWLLRRDPDGDGVAPVFDGLTRL